ncbi:MAG: methionine synthase [Zestosphaera sp.]
MRSSHVGSFPLEHSLQNVGRILKDLATLGIDVPPYPQMRGFIDIYVSPLMEVGVVSLTEGFLRTDVNALASQDLRSLCVPEAELAVRTVKESGLKFKGLRAPVTGVFTLASRIYLRAGTTDLSSTALSSKDLLKGFFTEYVSRYVSYMSSIGFDLVFIDEPTLGLMVGARRNLFNYRDEDLIEVLEMVARAAGAAEVGVHVCGRIHRRILELLTQVKKIKYLSFEFHDNPGNVEVIDRHLLETNDKIISPGIVSSRRPILESESEVLDLLKRIYEKAGGRVDLVCGDCGFAGLRGSLANREEEYRLALSKLGRVVRAVKSFCQAGLDILGS